jgi:hypothetical protein
MSRLALLLLIVVPVFAQTTDSSHSIQPGSSVQLMEITTATSFVITGNAGDSLVKISLKDGTVSYGKTYTPDKAADAFWQAIASKYPCKSK